MKPVGYYVRSPLMEFALCAIVVELTCVVVLLAVLVSKA